MGNIHNSKVSDLVQTIGLSKIEHGLTEQEAEALFDNYDVNKDGVLGKDEAKQLFEDINRAAIKRLEEQLEQLQKHLSDEVWVGELLHTFSDSDDKVEKQSFINTIMQGYHPEAEIIKAAKHLEEIEAKEQAEAEAEGNEPQKKKQKVDEN